MNSQQLSERKYHVLKEFWGYDEFRDPQEEIIDSVIAGRDTLALLPTGAGKSLCYQLPALLLEGCCLVVSPLLALMRDQVLQLKKIGIEAEYLSSELDQVEQETIFAGCRNGITKLLYVSPERLSNPVFIGNMEETDISFIAVDEAHCISEWGQDFRPGYQKIIRFRNEFKNVPFLALTATATPKVMQEIESRLGLRHPNIVKKSFRRENLFIIHNEISDKFTQLHDFLSFNKGPGIIYTKTRGEAEQLTEFLRKNGHNNVNFFHAGLSAKEKHQRQQVWLNSINSVLISTNAFGMGIDKDDVRFVIHYSPPASIENYYQEIGRAGRDGAESDALMLWNRQEISDFDELLMAQIPDKKSFLRTIDFLYSIFQIAEHDGSDLTFELSLQRLQKLAKIPMGAVKNVLNFLHNQEIIFLNTQKTSSSAELLIDPQQIDLVPKKESWFIEHLLRNLPGIHRQKAHFSELMLSKIIGTTPDLLQRELRDTDRKGHIRYTSGAATKIRFLKIRDSRRLEFEYWPLFRQIQQNKLQKWEEMKFFVRDRSFCKMRMILSYFGEKGLKDCGKCMVCQKKNEDFFGTAVQKDIKQLLAQKPASIEEIAAKASRHSKKLLLENLIMLLDAGEIKMLDFRTYALA